MNLGFVGVGLTKQQASELKRLIRSLPIKGFTEPGADFSYSCCYGPEPAERRYVLVTDIEKLLDEESE